MIKGFLTFSPIFFLFSLQKNSGILFRLSPKTIQNLTIKSYLQNRIYSENLNKHSLTLLGLST